MYCKYCGKPQNEGLFCQYCGKRQYAEDIPATEFPTDEFPTDEFTANDSVLNELPAAADSDASKDGSGAVVKGAVIGFLIAAIGVGAALGVMLSIRGKLDKDNAADSTPKSSLAGSAVSKEEETAPPTETTTTTTAAATTTTTTTTTTTATTTTPEPEPVVPEVDDGWKDAYMQAIDDFVNEFGSTPDFIEDNIRFSLYNADEDDIPELIINGSGMVGVHKRVYTYYDGRVVMLLETDGSAISDIRFPTMKNKVYLLSMPGAGIYYTEYEIRDGQLIQIDEFMIDYDHSIREERGVEMAELTAYSDTDSLRRAMDEY